MIRIEEHHPIASLNTFHDSYTCRYFAESDDIFELVSFLDEHRIQRYLIIGSGSNLLFTKNFQGAVLRPLLFGKHLINETDDSATVLIGASEIFDEVVEWTLSQHLYGLENLSLIPGTMGAAPVQNIGAYGCEIKDSVQNVQCFDLFENTFVSFSNADCQFDYRNSFFKKNPGRYIIVAVSLKLSKTPHPKADYPGIAEVINQDFDGTLTSETLRQAIIAIRKKKLPDTETFPNAGSFFKNPVISQTQFDTLLKQYPDIPHYPQKDGIKIPAAWCIDQAGWKGKSINGVSTYKNQPLILIKTTTDTPGKTVVDYAHKLIDSVHEKFGITLVPEVNIF
jgi:UDP-N-acetylmuramate dehydrogenase